MARKLKKTLQIFKTTICRNFRNHRFKNRTPTNTKYQEQTDTITMMRTKCEKIGSKKESFSKNRFQGLKREEVNKRYRKVD